MKLYDLQDYWTALEKFEKAGEVLMEEIENHQSRGIHALTQETVALVVAAVKGVKQALDEG